MGMKVLAVSCITNLAAGMSKEPLSHEEVIQVASRMHATFALCTTCVALL